MEFLNEDRFRGSGNKARQFTATLTWADGTLVEVNLGDDAQHLKPERVRYLPQHFIEELCNEIVTGNGTNFGRELRKVIFSHVPHDQHVGMGTLDELLDYKVEARRQAIAQIRQSIRNLNETIVRNEQEISNDTMELYRKSLALKQSELDALDKNPITPVAMPHEDPTDDKTMEDLRQINEKRTILEGLRADLEKAKNDRQVLVAEIAALDRLVGHVENFEASHKAFKEDHQEEFDNSGFAINEIVNIMLNKAPLTEAKARAISRLSAIQIVIDGKAATATAAAVIGLKSRVKADAEAVTQLQEGLDAPNKAYQAYLKELESRDNLRSAIVGAADKPDTIEYFNDRIKRAVEIIPEELARFREERLDFVRKLHTELLAMRTTYEELYAPVQRIASEAATPTHSIQLEFDASVATSGFESDFLAFIHRGKRGTFYGEEESRATLRNMLRSYDFNSTESAVEFAKAIINALSFNGRDGMNEQLQIGSQLKDKKKLSALYDYIFCLGYLEIKYTLRLGGKDISQLSPGEKGALLLVFYLLLDVEEIPIIIDQPEHNLDNESVVRLLVECIRMARARRQVIIVTHNPNLAVYCDADQIICCTIDKSDGHRIDYSTGAIEDYDINEFAVNILEGTYLAFDNRQKSGTNHNQRQWYPEPNGHWGHS